MIMELAVIMAMLMRERGIPMLRDQSLLDHFFSRLESCSFHFL